MARVRAPRRRCQSLPGPTHPRRLGSVVEPQEASRHTAPIAEGRHPVAIVTDVLGCSVVHAVQSCQHGWARRSPVSSSRALEL
eukprot:6179877-Pleurochrysis_carterae.AAC.9